jgi:hypothetical protein
MLRSISWKGMPENMKEVWKNKRERERLPVILSTVVTLFVSYSTLCSSPNIYKEDDLLREGEIKRRAFHTPRSKKTRK